MKNKLKISNITIKFKRNIKIFFINLFFVVIIIINNLSYKLKILLCTIAKKENKYIKEFIEHYKKMNIKKIIIYDNNDINGEVFQDILKNEIKNNFVKIMNYRGIKQPQAKALDNCYKIFNKKFNWIAFYDIDEFLQIRNFNDINDFLSLPRFKKCQSILINWKNFGDNDKLYYESKPLSERFPKPFYLNKSKKYSIYFRSAAKTIVRGGLKIEWGHLPHYLKNTINCRPDGTILKNYFSPPQYSVAYLNHYTTKSTEEYADKLNKGDVILRTDKKYIKNKIFNYYFLFNSKTKKKFDIFKKKLKYKIPL